MPDVPQPPKGEVQFQRARNAIWQFIPNLICGIHNKYQISLPTDHTTYWTCEITQYCHPRHYRTLNDPWLMFLEQPHNSNKIGYCSWQANKIKVVQLSTCPDQRSQTASQKENTKNIRTKESVLFKKRGTATLN